MEFVFVKLQGCVARHAATPETAFTENLFRNMFRKKMVQNLPQRFFRIVLARTFKFLKNFLRHIFFILVE